ncbi:pyridoxamine 5'-phosphate oxidase family protein [Lentzea sp. NPDC004782]|uniref:pyridoxamine 5'-phosphate oxidase family protein n=1 Tax=Lentzea sp. NPDC004782 TaxID=3154458 RepID=UPI0033AB124F
MGGLTHQMRPVSASRALDLLASCPFGRVVLSERALPAIRLVNHVVEGDALVIRTCLEQPVRPGAGIVVAYQADAIDPQTRAGWSVVVVGLAERIVDADEILHYEQILPSWSAGDIDQVIRIRPHLVTGHEHVLITTEA